MQGRYARIGLLVLATALAPSGSQAVEGPGSALIPAPVRLKARSGAFELRDDTVLLADAAGLAEAGKLAAAFAPATGFSLEVVEGSPGRSRRALGLCGFGARETSSCRTWIHLRSRASRSVGDEGYQLTVKNGGVKIRARSAAGLFYAAQTLRQLLPPSVFSRSPVAGPAWVAPAVRIKDYPRFSWRGAHLDVARHFIPKQDVMRLLDAMALHKLNRFHWHLTDDQGWRVEIRQYPNLTQVGAVRAESPSRSRAAQAPQSASTRSGMSISRTDGILQTSWGASRKERGSHCSVTCRTSKSSSRTRFAAARTNPRSAWSSSERCPLAAFMPDVSVHTCTSCTDSTP